MIHQDYPNSTQSFNPESIFDEPTTKNMSFLPNKQDPAILKFAKDTRSNENMFSLEVGL